MFPRQSTVRSGTNQIMTACLGKRAMSRPKPGRLLRRSKQGCQRDHRQRRQPLMVLCRTLCRTRRENNAADQKCDHDGCKNPKFRHWCFPSSNATNIAACSDSRIKSCAIAPATSPYSPRSAAPHRATATWPPRNQPRRLFIAASLCYPNAGCWRSDRPET